MQPFVSYQLCISMARRWMCRSAWRRIRKWWQEGYGSCTIGPWGWTILLMKSTRMPKQKQDEQGFDGIVGVDSCERVGGYAHPGVGRRASTTLSFGRRLLVGGRGGVGHAAIFLGVVRIAFTLLLCKKGHMRSSVRPLTKLGTSRCISLFFYAPASQTHIASSHWHC